MLSSQYDLTKFGNIVKSIRIKQNFSLEKLSYNSGLAVNTIRNVESGSLYCSMDTVETLSLHLNTDLFEVLSNQKNPLLNEALQIKCNLDVDLSNRDYSKLDYYIESLKSLLDVIKYNPNDKKHVEFFNYIDKMIFWIEGVKLTNSENFIEAEDSLIKSLLVTHSDFSLENLIQFHFTGLDLNIFNTFISARLNSENFSNIDLYISFLKQELLAAPNYLHETYIGLCFNYATLHFHREQYNDAIALANETLAYMNKYKIKTDFATLLFVKSVSRYKLGLTNSTDEIKAALDSFIYEGKQDLIPTVIENLKTSYGIEVDYSISSSINNLLS